MTATIKYEAVVTFNSAKPKVVTFNGAKSFSAPLGQDGPSQAEKDAMDATGSTKSTKSTGQ